VQSLRALRGEFLARFLFAVLILVFPSILQAQSNSGIVEGTVVDPSKSAVPGAKVHLENPVSGHVSQVETDGEGNFHIPNIPFNLYHLTVTAQGFATYTQDVDVRSTVPIVMTIGLTVGIATTNITVTEAAAELVQATAEERTNVDRGLFDELPLESQSSSVSSLITLASPGIAADSNGLFHGLGDHAENSFSVDGQPITDQVSKVFSNQIPADSIQSLEVIEGAPPAEYGGKTSVIAVVTTRSGLGQSQAHGSVTASYGSFGSTNEGFDVAYGGKNWGNFISIGGLNTSRFLDPPEFQVLHDKGNEENAFDRLDYKLSDKDTIQLNLAFTRSWFQTPNTWDQQLQTCTVLSAMCDPAGEFVLNPITGNPLSPTDQRSQIKTFNIAPSWTHLIGSTAVFTLGAFVRHDQYNYYPSNDPFADLGPLQDETVSQLRFLTNAGLRTDLVYVKGAHNLKIGLTAEHTFLTEKDAFGVVNPGLIPNCAKALAADCAILVPFDLTAGGSLYDFRGKTDVKEYALYAEDTISKGPWSISLGLRGDFYDGLEAVSRQAEPRGGLAYNVKKTHTVLRLSYARTMESPFNENLVLTGTGCSDPVVNAIMTVAQGFACTTAPLTPGYRNEFHAGLQQAFGKYFVLSGEYIWKYTHNAYDFNVFGTSPITLPIEWHNSKIPGFAVRGGIPNFHGLTGFIVLSHVAARFFPPVVSGITPPQPPGVFRIDHDEIFNQTTHLQYQPFKRLPWASFNWRYDSGLVSGFVPCLALTATCAFTTSPADGGTGVIPGTSTPLPAGVIGLSNNFNGLPLTADQEFEGGLTCNGVAATPTTPLPSVCPASQLGSTLIKIPSPNTENDDHNPQRIAPRNLFDVALGEDNLLNGDRYKWSLRFTVINLTNKVALYNFLSTFSGTHYVTPRTSTVELGFHF
jgi:Carboxypeptidase regulatory-like domain/TonB dependent receptor